MENDAKKKETDPSHSSMAYMRLSTDRIILLSGILDFFIGVVPFVGPLIVGIIAGYYARKKSPLSSAGIGIAPSLLAGFVWFVIYMFIPSIIMALVFGIGTSNHVPGLLSGPVMTCAIVNTSIQSYRTSVCGMISSTSSIVGLFVIELFVFGLIGGSVGGVVGSWLANRKIEVDPR